MEKIDRIVFFVFGILLIISTLFVFIFGVITLFNNEFNISWFLSSVLIYLMSGLIVLNTKTYKKQ